MKCTTAVDGHWLAELGSIFFSIKESYADRIAKRKRDEFYEQSMTDNYTDTKRLEAHKSQENSSTRPTLPIRSSWRDHYDEDFSSYTRHKFSTSRDTHQPTSNYKMCVPGSSSSSSAGKKSDKKKEVSSSASSSLARQKKAPIAGFM